MELVEHTNCFCSKFLNIMLQQFFISSKTKNITVISILNGFFTCDCKQMTSDT